MPDPTPQDVSGSAVLPESAVRSLISETIAKEVPGAIKEAMAPLMTARMSTTSGPVPASSTTTTLDADAHAKEREALAIDKALGPHPYGRKVRALALAALDGHAGDPEAAMAGVRKWRLAESEPTLKWLSHVKTTMSAGVAATAGDMVFPSYDPEWIALLRNNAVVRGMARTVPMPRGATSIRRQTGAGTAYYQGENDNLTVSNQTVGRINLSYKKLTALSVVSNDLLRFSAGDADRLVQEDLLAVMALREDRAFLVGNPPIDAGSPQGIRYQTAVANVFASAGASLANFQSDLTTAIRRVQASNVPATPLNSAFIMSVATFWTIYALATTTGDMVFAAGLSGATPQIFGFPIKVTTQLEVSNSWVGANAGMVFFVHGPSVQIHDSMSRTIAAYPGGTYYDAATAGLLSGISRDETVITCIAEHDMAQVYSTAASVITGYAT